MRRPQVKIGVTVIPNIFTVLNMFFGFLAIVMITQGEFGKGAWLILAAAFFDLMDGNLARLFNTPTKFGIEFDSIADLISFCVVPAILVYFAYVDGLNPLLAAVISFIPLFFGGIRLARFNVITSKHPLPFYLGLTTTAMAVIMASFVLFNLKLNSTAGDPRIALPLVFLLSYLMISPIRYGKVPNIKKVLDNKLFLFYVGLGFISVLIFGSMAFFPMSILYVLWGLINWVIHHNIYEMELKVKPVTSTNKKRKME